MPAFGQSAAPGAWRSARAATSAGRLHPRCRKATVTKLFRTPDGHPNALDVSPEGFWVGEQVTDRVVLMDIHGQSAEGVSDRVSQLQRLAVGGGHLWLSANGAPQFDRPIKIDNTSQEILQCEMDGRVIKRHTVPLGGGGATGIEYVDGTLWMVASRLRALLQVNAHDVSADCRASVSDAAAAWSRVGQRRDVGGRWH